MKKLLCTQKDCKRLFWTRSVNPKCWRHRAKRVKISKDNTIRKVQRNSDRGSSDGLSDMASRKSRGRRSSPRGMRESD